MTKNNTFFDNIDLDEKIVVKKTKKPKQIIHNLIILDKSGSMNSVRDVTISGLNEQLQSIKKASKNFKNQTQKVSLVTFSDNVDFQVWNKDIKDVEEFTQDNYSPDGLTSLYDAIGMGVTKLKNKLNTASAKKKNNIVIVTILTDGYENCSKEYNNNMIKDLLKDVQDTGKWTVAFMGCGDDVLDVAASMNISAGNAMTYSAGSEGTTKAFSTMANSRYTRSCLYTSCQSQADMVNVNQSVGFFDNLDIDDDAQNIGEVEPDGDIDLDVCRPTDKNIGEVLDVLYIDKNDNCNCGGCNCCDDNDCNNVN